jgi:hypothetical protein
MIIRTTISPKLQSLVRRVVQSHGNSLRPMTVLSKQSAEEYKKQVRPELVCVCVCVCVCSDCRDRYAMVHRASRLPLAGE